MEVVLVLDAQQRSALAVVRSLGAVAEVVCADVLDSNFAASSRYCSAQEVYASPSNVDEFVADINRIISKYDVKVLYPTTEVTLYTLLEHKDELLPVILPFPSLEVVKKVSDKSSLVSLCEDLNLLVPKSISFSCGKELLESDLECSFPLVLKPTLSRVKTETGWLSTSVTYAQDKADLHDKLATNVAFRDHPFMVQEYIEGYGSGVFLLYDHGKCVAHFAHKRLREKPPSGGVSVLSESAQVNPKQLEAAKVLLDHVAWHGVAMVEFKVTDSDQPYVIEVNPRFWGSLQLAVDAGVDFPRLLHEVSTGKGVVPVTTYEKGVQLRWLLGDFDRLYLVLKSREYSLAAKIREFFFFMLPWRPKRRFEVNRLGDMKPFLIELKQYVKALRGD